MTTTPEREALAGKVLRLAHDYRQADYSEASLVAIDLKAAVQELAASPAAGGVQPLTAGTVIKAILAVDQEAARRGGMFPQTYDEQRVDRKATTRVTEMIAWYEKNTGCAHIEGWPALLAATPPAAPAQATPATPEDEAVYVQIADRYFADTAAASDEREAPHEEVSSIARLLFDTWCRVDSRSNVAMYPESYRANFADMARAVIAARAPQAAAERRPANLEAEFVRAKSALANRLVDAFEHDATAPQPTAQAEAVTAAAARRMYAKWCDEQGIHSNRFPSWPELSDSERVQWLAKAQASIAEGDRNV